MTCPRCGGVVELVRDGVIGELVLPGYVVVGRPLPIRTRPATFAACTECEFCSTLKAFIKALAIPPRD